MLVLPNNKGTCSILRLTLSIQLGRASSSPKHKAQGYLPPGTLVAPANLDARKRQKTACSSFLSSCRKDPGFPTAPGNKRLEKDEDNSTLGHLHVGLHLMGGNGSGIQGKDCRGGGERAANTEKQTSRREGPWEICESRLRRRSQALAGCWSQWCPLCVNIPFKGQPSRKPLPGAPTSAF